MARAKRKSVKVGGIAINLKHSPATIWIIGILILIYLIDIATRYWIDGTYGLGLLSMYGMRINSEIIDGQYWRLVTPALLHGSWSHLLLNCFALFIWGRMVENLYDSKRYVAILAAAGITGIAMGFAFSVNNSLGASGMAYGLFGALLAFRKYDKAFFSIYFGIQVLIFIALSYGSGLLDGGIDNWAHLGGFIGGYLMANSLSSKAQKEFSLTQLLWGTAYVGFTGLFIYIGL